MSSDCGLMELNIIFFLKLFDYSLFELAGGKRVGEMLSKPAILHTIKKSNKAVVQKLSHCVSSKLCHLPVERRNYGLTLPKSTAPLKHGM